MLSLVKKNAAFFIPYFLFLLCGGVAFIYSDKISIALFINSLHFSAGDIFFKYWTYVGLGLLIIPVAFYLAFIRLRYVIMAAATFLITIIINDTLKFAVGAPRPAEVFGQLHQTLYFVPGVKMDHWNSFPSGHSAISFALFSLLAFISPKNFVKFLFFVAAFLVAYSRMYLSEHFLVDVYVASIISVSSSLFSYTLCQNLSWLNKFAAMDKPVINLHKA